MYSDWLMRTIHVQVGSMLNHSAYFVNNFDVLFSGYNYYRRNGKCHSCAYIELWIHLGGLLSTQEARVALGNYLE